jgi:nucleoside phosphorylase
LLASRVHDFAVSAALEGGILEHQQQGGAVHMEVEKLLTHLKAIRKELGNWSSPQNIGSEKPIEKIPDNITDSRLYGSEEWKIKVKSSLETHFPPKSATREPIFKVAPMITSNTLVKNAELASRWRQTARHAVGVEMELGGVYLAARYGGNGNTRVLAIRGVSDIVGYKRAPQWTEYACRSAAAFAFALITSGRIRKTSNSIH